MTDRELMQQALELEALIDAARLLGVTQAKQGFGCYTQEDARFEQAMHEAVQRHRTALRERLARPEYAYLLPDDLYQSKNWKAGTYAERVEWLHSMYEAKKRELEDYLAQPQQEPVAWKHDCAALLTNGVELWVDCCPHCGKSRTAPPRREWVGLTDEDLSVCDEDGVMLARYWERVLREKNNG